IAHRLAQLHMRVPDIAARKLFSVRLAHVPRALSMIGSLSLPTIRTATDGVGGFLAGRVVPQRRVHTGWTGRRSAFGQPRIARRPPSVIRLRSILTLPPPFPSVSVTTVA